MAANANVESVLTQKRSLLADLLIDSPELVKELALFIEDRADKESEIYNTFCVVSDESFEKFLKDWAVRESNKSAL